MDENLVCFAHGKESGPWGTKIRVLTEVAQQRGFVVQSIDFQGLQSPAERVEKLLRCRPRARRRLVMVGSSMGAYVSVLASQQLNPLGLFLMAPAFYLPGYESIESPPAARLVQVVHGWRDEVVPVDYAIRFAREHGAELVLLHAKHNLVEALPILKQLFAGFLDRVASVNNPLKAR